MKCQQEELIQEDIKGFSIKQGLQLKQVKLQRRRLEYTFNIGL